MRTALGTANRGPTRAAPREPTKPHAATERQIPTERPETTPAARPVAPKLAWATVVRGGRKAAGEGVPPVLPDESLALQTPIRKPETLQPPSESSSSQV